MKALALLAALAASLPAGAATPRRTFETGVVSLTITYQTWDQERPWAKRPPQYRRPLAVVVAGPHLLTTAQMVSDATFIEVEKLGLARRVPARIERVDPDADLALLQVDDPGFYADLKPVRLAEWVPVEGSVESVRWRNRQVEVSTSRVSRIEVQPTVARSVEHAFLYVTTDLRGGGWSEPAFFRGRFVGLTESQTEQSARVLPVDMIATFLAMASEEGEYRGFGRLGIEWQANEDPALAAYLGLPGEPRGVVVTATPQGGSAFGRLAPRDVLLTLDGQAIDASGYYRHPRYGILLFPNIATDRHRAGDTLRVEVWREGRTIEVDLPLKRAWSETDLVPDRRPDTPPAYVVAGGLVFRELDGAYLRAWGDNWRDDAPVGLLIWQALFGEDQDPERRRLVMISAVLPSAYNLGYHDLGDVPVKAINGRPVGSISAVEEAFRHPQGKVHRISLHPNGQRSEVVLDAETFETATREVLEEYRIPERIRLEKPPPPL